MSKIIFILPGYKHSYKNINLDSMGYKLIPFGLSLMESMIRKHSHEVKIVDMDSLNNPLDEFKMILKKEKPDFIGISCMTASVDESLNLAKISKLISPKTKVILGGYHPSAMPFDIIKNKNIDYVMVGEGERTVVEMLNKVSLKKIKGIFYKKDGKVISNTSNEMILDLDKQPFPFYPQLYKSKKDFKKYGVFNSNHTVSILESRGCSYDCIFCSNNVINGKIARYRNYKNVISEIEMLLCKYGISNFMFFDAGLTLNRKRLEKLCNEIIRKRLKIKWTCCSRVDKVDKSILKLMKKSGCTSIYFGIESGDNEILKITKKQITTEQVEKSVNLANKMGFTIIGVFMIGLPFDDKITVNKTIKFAKRLPLDYAQFSVAIPLPGTKMWDMAKNKQGLEMTTLEWKKFSSYGDPVIKTNLLSNKQLIYFQKKAYKQFYLRPKYILNKLIHPKRFVQDVKNLFILLKFLKAK